MRCRSRRRSRPGAARGPCRRRWRGSSGEGQSPTADQPLASADDSAGDHSADQGGEGAVDAAGDKAAGDPGDGEGQESDGPEQPRPKRAYRSGLRRQTASPAGWRGRWPAAPSWRSRRCGPADQEQDAEDDEPDAPQDVADEVGVVDHRQIQRGQDAGQDQHRRRRRQEREPPAGERHSAQRGHDQQRPGAVRR